MRRPSTIAFGPVLAMLFAGSMGAAPQAISPPSRRGSGVNVAVQGRAGGHTEMAEKLFEMLLALEKTFPPTEAMLRSSLGVSFAVQEDRNGAKVLVSKSIGPNPFGVAISRVEFHPPQGENPGDLFIVLSGSTIDSREVEKRFPGGSWAPPPPPGWGPADAGPVDFVDRSWGQFLFAFGRGDILRSVDLGFGKHGSPGI